MRRLLSLALAAITPLGLSVLAVTASCKKDQSTAVPTPRDERAAAPEDRLAASASAAVLTPAVPRADGDPSACDTRLGRQGAPVTCMCAPDAMTGPVWGSDIYTTDSAICAAALHAGVVTRAGGAVVVVPTGGCRTYNGVTRNGISSGAWGEYESSFYFKGYGDGKCQTETPGCPGAFGQILNVSAATVRECDCGPKPPDGSVWGTAIYTSDSSICAAAWHAGAVTTRGGKVTVKGAPGCGSYKGSVQNGVASADWGSYQLSFFFPAKGPAKCP